MHELSLCRALIDQLQQQAAVSGFSRVTQIWLEVGVLAAVVPEAIQFGFEAASHGTLAQGAQLHIIRLPAEAYCRACGVKTDTQQRYQPCPHCGEFQLEVVSGETLSVRELEVE